MEYRYADANGYATGELGDEVREMKQARRAKRNRRGRETLEGRDRRWENDWN